jgi:hypothetical protein
VNRTAFVATGLFAATLLSRAPFFAEHLWAWDSVLYARALESGFHVDYALAGQRPHPPGYLLYVATAAVARGLVGDSNTALVLISAAASALAAAVLFLFARRFVSSGAAGLISVAFALDPLVWQYSEVAYPYALLGLLSVTLAACFFAARARGTAAAAVLASLAFGAAAGFRQDLLLILAALWLWMIWRLSPRVRLVAAASVCAGCLVWLVPTALLSGGPLAYVDAVMRQTDYVRATYSVPAQGLSALSANLAATLYALAWGLGLCALPIAGLALVGARRAVRARRVVLGRTDGFLVAWIAPAISLYVLLHIGEWGYVLSVLPGLYVLAAIGIDRFVKVPRIVRRAALASAAVSTAFAFVATSAPFSAAAIAHRDDELAARVSFVRQHYSPDSTLVLAREDFLLVRYYLPEYHSWFHDFDPYRLAMRRKRAPKVNAIIAFSPGLKAASIEARRVECAKGVHLVYLDIDPGSIVELYGERYGVVESQRR